jgi:hypothetical protein
MSVFKKRIDIGKTIAGRIIGYPAVRREPKTPPKCYIICPDLKISPPKKLKGDEQYEYSVIAYSENQKTAMEMLDKLLRWGRREIEARDLRFWLHAVKHSIRHVKGKPLFRADLKYIFRVEEIQEEISQEV